MAGESSRRNSEFDPYHKWLGIPPSEQPPDHYRLLGLVRFEDDDDVIEAAANRQMEYVRQQSQGPHLEASQKLLNELSKARVCLLKPKKKSAYDAELKSREAPSPGVFSTESVTESAPPPLPTIDTETEAEPEQKRSFLLPMGMAAAGGMLAVAIVLIVTRGGSDDSIVENPPPKTPSKKSETDDEGTLVLTWPVKDRSGASLLLDGKSVDADVLNSKDDALLFTLETGKHVIKLKRPNKTDWERTIAVSRNATMKLAVDEKPVTTVRQFGRIVLNWPSTERAGAVVFVNGMKTDVGAKSANSPTVRMRVEAGTYRIRITRPEHDPFEAEIEVKGNATETVTVRWGPPPPDIAEAPWHDVLKRTDPAAQLVVGEWSKQGDALKAEEGAIELPLRLAGEYNLDLDFTSSSDSPLSVFLPMAEKTVEFVMQPGTAAGLNQLRGKAFSENATTTKLPPAKPDTRQRLHFEVRTLERGRAAIRATLGDTQVVNWQGFVPEFPDRQPLDEQQSPVLAAANTVVHAARVQAYNDAIVWTDGPPPRVAATVQHEFNNQTPPAETYFANGCIGTPRSTSRWSLNKDVLTVYWTGGSFERGDTYLCKLSSDGRSFAGGNQAGNKTLAGTVVSGDLRNSADGEPARDFINEPLALKPPLSPTFEIADDDPAANWSRMQKQYESALASDLAHRKLAVAARLIQAAEAATAAPRTREKLLTEAMRLASSHGDASLTMRAVELLHPADLTARAKAASQQLEALDAVIKDLPQRSAVHHACLEVMRLCVQTEAFETLDRVVQMGRSNAAKSKVRGWREEFQRESDRATRAKSLFESYQAARPSLADNTASASQIAAASRYQTLVRRNWDEALPLLAKESNASLKNAATALLEDRENPSAVLAMANGCWAEAERMKRTTGFSLLWQDVAREWYRQAPTELNPDQRKRVIDGLVTNIPTGRPETTTENHLLPVVGLGAVDQLTPANSRTVAAQPGAVALLRSGRNKSSLLQYPEIESACYVYEAEVTLKTTGSPTLIAFAARSVRGPRVWLRRQSVNGGDRLHMEMQVLSGQPTRPVITQYELSRPTVKLTLYVTPERFRVEVDGEGMTVRNTWPVNPATHISAHRGGELVINTHRLRAWTPWEARLLGWKEALPEPANPKTAAVVNRSRDLALRDTADLKAKDRDYFLAETGTPMIWINPGKFTRTYPESESKTDVSISRGFWISREEITQSAWLALMGEPISASSRSGWLPAELSREQAVAFCERVTRNERRRPGHMPSGYVYRLPTEAEWEYVCRADANANLSVNEDGFWHEKTAGGRVRQAGLTRPNAWGVFDMHGNLREWCFDHFADLPKTPPLSQVDPVTIANPSSGRFVARGGGFHEPAEQCGTSIRHSQAGGLSAIMGLRLVLAPELETD